MNMFLGLVLTARQSKRAGNAPSGSYEQLRQAQ